MSQLNRREYATVKQHRIFLGGVVGAVVPSFGLTNTAIAPPGWTPGLHALTTLTDVTGMQVSAGRAAANGRAAGKGLW